MMQLKMKIKIKKTNGILKVKEMEKPCARMMQFVGTCFFNNQKYGGACEETSKLIPCDHHLRWTVTLDCDIQILPIL